MTKIGIIGSDKYLFQLADLFRGIDGFELTGWFNDNYNDIAELSLPYNVIPYPTIEALFRYVDAIALSHEAIYDTLIIEKCLKHFKHVFLMGAQNLKYDNFIYLEKIAEESNVKFYLEFGGHFPEIIEGLNDISKDIHYIDINHTFGPNEGICVDNRLSLALLRDLNFVNNLVKANIKKISANGWGFCEPGAGMLNTKLDFDNGASANLLLVNSIKPKQIQAVVYGKSGITRIFVVDNIYKITKESLSHGQLEEFEKITSSNNQLKDELKLFLSAIQQKSFGLRCIDDKFKSFRLNHLVHEKVNHFASNNIFYS